MDDDAAEDYDAVYDQVRCLGGGALDAPGLNEWRKMCDQVRAYGRMESAVDS